MADESLWQRIRPPLWARWALSLLVAAGVVVALVAFVHSHNDNGLAHVNAKAERRANEEADVVIGADQAPRTVTVAGDSAAAAQAALTRGVRADMRHRIATGNVDGPLQSVGCRRAGSRDGRVAYRCAARAAQVTYPFLAVATASRHRAVYCKRDAPPVPSENIPVSPRCRL